jgi:hypothetical protein
VVLLPVTVVVALPEPVVALAEPVVALAELVAALAELVAALAELVAALAEDPVVAAAETDVPVLTLLTAEERDVLAPVLLVPVSRLAVADSESLEPDVPTDPPQPARSEPAATATTRPEASRRA